MELSRRNFLWSVSALPMTITPHSVSQAFVSSGDRRSGKSVLNLFYVTAGRDYPFLNFIKAGTQIQPSSWIDSSYTPFPALMGTDGYLTNTASAVLNFGNGYIPVFGGYWVLKWTGTASFVLTCNNQGGLPTFCSDYAPARNFSNPSATQITISGGASGTETRVTFKIHSSVNRIVFQSRSAFRDLVFCQGDPNGNDRTKNLLGTEEYLLSIGEIFRPDFLSTLRALNPGTLRFMQWSNSEYSLNSSFELENTELTLAWGTMRQDPRLWCGDASVSGRPDADRYSVTPPASYPGGFPKTKTHGAMIQCRFVSGNVSNHVTLNPGGLWGDVALASTVRPGSTVISPGAILTNSLATLTYDSILDRFFFKRDYPGLGSSAPLAVQVALCNKLGCNLWWNIPYLYTNQSIAAAISYIAQHLKPGLKAIVEWSNEVFLGSYFATAYANEAAKHLWGLNNQNSTFYAYKLMQIFASDGPIVPTWTAIRPRNELICMMGCWVIDHSVAGVRQRWEGSLLPAPPVYPKRPIDLCDAACCAYYTWGAQLTTDEGGMPSYTRVPASARQDLWNAADDYASGDANRIQAALQWVDHDYRAGTCRGITPTGTISYFNDVMNIWNMHCTRYGLTHANGKGFWWYEGGYQSSPPTVDQCRKLQISQDYSRKVSNLLTAYKRSKLFRNSIRTLFDQFMSKSNSVAPGWYMFIGNGSSNKFSLFQDDLYSTPWASFRAIAEFDG